MAELQAGAPNPAVIMRSRARLIGSPEYGALWHCAAHAVDCPTCPRGSSTDLHPADPGPYTEHKRHTRPTPPAMSYSADPACPARTWHHNYQRCPTCGGIA